MGKIKEGDKIKIPKKKLLRINEITEENKDVQCALKRLERKDRELGRLLYREIQLAYPETKKFILEYDSSTKEIIIGRPLMDYEIEMFDHTKEA